MTGMEADDLYGLALDEFVSERAALAKALRADKRRDEAAEVAALRKPSIAAWAVNQLVRTQHDAVQALFHAGDGLRGAQEDLLAGRGDGRKLRAAGACEREAVDRLVEAARGLLTSAGHELSAAVVQRVDDTLHAAALDEEAREQIRGGCLERELRHVGLGLGFGESLAATPEPRAAKRAAVSPDSETADGTRGGRSKPTPSEAGVDGPLGGSKRKRGKAADANPSAAERRAERERAAAERAEAARAERERTAARQALRAVEAAARRRADAAARALEKAERQRDDAEQALRDADTALTSAREAAEDAAAEHERARAEREDA